jgi:hypothetical protein
VLKFLKFPSANVVEFVDFILCTHVAPHQPSELAASLTTRHDTTRHDTTRHDTTHDQRHCAGHNLHAGYGGTDKIREINCTGGGAYKFREIVKSKLGIQLVPCDEMRSMIRGLNFLLRNTKNEIFCFTNRTKKVHENVTMMMVCVVCRVSCVLMVMTAHQCG